MLRQSEPTSSTLQLVANDLTGIMETLDSRELDLEDGEYDTTDAHGSGERVHPHLSLYPTPPPPPDTCLCASRSRAPSLHGRLPHGGFQGGRGQRLPVLAGHGQVPGGGALHQEPGPLQRDGAEERQQGVVFLAA